MDERKKAAGGSDNSNSTAVLKPSGDDSPSRSDQRQQKRPFLLSSSRIQNEMNGNELLFVRCASYLCSFQSSDASTDFSAAQLVLQSSSLLTNRNKHPNANDEDQVISNHLLALENSLTFTGDLTIDILRNWHGILCGDGLSSSTEFRTKRVRCGPTTFCDAKDVSEMMIDYVCQVNVIMVCHFYVTAPLSLSLRIPYQSPPSQSPPLNHHPLNHPTPLSILFFHRIAAIWNPP